MKLDLAELRNLNPRDFPAWPPLAKLAMLALMLLLIVGAGFWFLWQPQIEELDAAKAKEAQLRETYLAKKKDAVNLDAYKQQLKDIEQAFGALLKQLPDKSGMDALLIDINQAGLGRGLQFELFKPAPSENLTEFYAELPISIRVTGNYHDIGAFASDVAQLPRIVTLSDINVTKAKEGGLAMDATARTYRYLDPEEVAQQRKAAKDKGKKK